MYKSRPIRLYSNKDDFFIFQGGKKKKISSSKKSKSTLQKELMDKIKAKISLLKQARMPDTNIPLVLNNPPVKLKYEQLQHVSQIKRPEDLDEYLLALRKNDPIAYKKYLEEKALSKKALSTEEKTALNVLEARVQETSAQDAKEELLNEIKTKNEELKNQAIELAKERELINEQTKRDENLIEQFEKIRVDYKYFPFRSWNGLHNGNTVKAAFKNQLLPFIKNLLKMTPYEIIDNVLGAARLSIPLTREETPPNRADYRAIDRDSLNTDEEKEEDDIRKAKISLRKKRELITAKILSFLTPKIFNMIINGMGRHGFNALGLTDIAPLYNITQLGKGSEDAETNNKLPALYNDEIEEFFSDRNIYPDFGGVISADQIKNLPKRLPIGFIMNLDKSDQPGSHWVAVYINGDSVEYFDPLANPPSESFKKDIKKYLESMHVPILMKFKINKIAQQHGNSARCGFHAIRFLDDRFAGTPYKWSTRFQNNSKEGEKTLKQEFDYI